MIWRNQVATVLVGFMCEIQHCCFRYVLFLSKLWKGPFPTSIILKQRYIYFVETMALL